MRRCALAALYRTVSRAAASPSEAPCHQGLRTALERLLLLQGSAHGFAALAVPPPAAAAAAARDDRRPSPPRTQPRRRSAAAAPPPPPQQQQQQGAALLSVRGPMQPYILANAAKACAEPSRESLAAFVRQLAELVAARGADMRPIHISSCFHRLSRAAVTYANTLGPLAHVDAAVAGTPGLDALLEDLAGLALAQMPAMDTWAIPNIMWALAILHCDPRRGELVTALVARTLELAAQGTHLAPMGCAHMFWGCATLKKAHHDELFEALGAHMLLPGVAAGLNHIDLSNIWWSCGALGLNPCGGRLLPALAADSTRLAPVMNQQGVSNVLWGLSKLDMGHADMWKMPGTPYLAMIEALLQRSAAMWATEGAAVNYSMTLWALGNLSYHPGDAYLRTLLAALAASGLVPGFDAQNIASLVWGFARLGEHPGAELIAALKQRRAEALFDNGRTGVENVQAIANVVWALCVFDELDPGFAAAVYARMDPATATEQAKAQLFQAHLYLEAALGGAGRAPAMPPALLRACREAWLGVRDNITVSLLQWDVLAALRRAGFADVHPEYSDTFFSVDLALFLGPQKVAVEVDGIDHYSCNRAAVGGVCQYRPLGRTVLRNRLLRAQGWAVCDVPWFEWNALRGHRARDSYLRARIALELQRLREWGVAAA